MWLFGLCGALALFSNAGLKSEATLEALRPRFHFTAPSGWLNDPNGLVYVDGVYHLFYQHNPFGTEWGNMTWGHATSKDLFHWENLPEAIRPDELGTIFSGSAVYDKAGTSGLGTKKKPALVCIYTAAGGTNRESAGKPFSQCLAYSLDGRTFTKFDGNPVIPNISHENRDPKVIWHAPTKKWVLGLYVRGGTYELLGSTDLKAWKKLSEVEMPGTDECPDFYEIRYGRGTKWIFSGANGNYRVGSFDGTNFVPETPVIRSHFGNTGYAGQSYSNVPGGRRIQIEWMRGADFPGAVWNQQMTLPNDLRLEKTEDGPRLVFQPAKELLGLRGAALTPATVTDTGDSIYNVESGLIDFEGKFEWPKAGDLVIEMNGTKLEISASSRQLKVLDHVIQLGLHETNCSLRVISDRTSLEIYAQGGLIWAPFFVLPKVGVSNGLVIRAGGSLKEGNLKGGIWKEKSKVYELRP